jgi:hypothetical protein
MGSEKRKDHRQSLKYPAKIDLGDGNPPIPCLLMDVSESGAKIVIEADSDIPERFTLLLAGAGGRRRRCRVVWQEGKQFGAVFIKAEAKDDASTPPSFREMMRRS